MTAAAAKSTEGKVQIATMLDQELYDRLVAHARANERTVAAEVRWLVRAAVNVKPPAASPLERDGLTQGE